MTGIEQLIKSTYPEGTYMESFRHLPMLSNYNKNYYVGIGSDILCGESDDDGTTYWFLIIDNEKLYMGTSFCSEDDKLRHIPNT